MREREEIWLPPSLEEVEGIPDEERWKLDLTWEKSSKGGHKVAGTIGNVEMILENDPLLKDRIRFNEFSTQIDAHDMPWRKENMAWDDNCDAYLHSYLEGYRTNGFTDKKVTKALLIVAQEHKYHPVREYLNALVWDGTPRVESLFIDHLKAEDTELYRNAALGFMVMSVKRIFEPGCNLQFMPVFIGKQGAGKSSLAQVLGGEWVSSSAIDINSKDGYIVLQGKWIVEIAEMNSFSKKEASSVKSYISSSKDSYRPPYGQHNVDVKRQCIFFGTTNDILCLADSTGNRRFWPIECHATEEDAYARLKALEEKRDQLWAEAMHYYRTDMARIERLIRDVNEGMKGLQERHNQVDPLEDDLISFLDFMLPGTWKDFSLPIRKAWYHDESARRSHYSVNTHDGDFVRSEFNVYDFCSEYLGMETSNGKYLATCNKIHRLMDDMAGWRRLDGMHRTGGSRARITYERVPSSQETNADKSEAVHVQPVQATLGFEENGHESASVPSVLQTSPSSSCTSTPISVQQPVQRKTDLLGVDDLSMYIATNRSEESVRLGLPFDPPDPNEQCPF